MRKELGVLLCIPSFSFETIRTELPPTQCRGTNGFLEAALMAFANHLPLILDPQDVWLAVLHGVANHIHLDPQAHTDLVRHEGQKTIRVYRPAGFVPGNPNNDWGSVFSELATKARDSMVEPSRFTWSGSTTTPVDTQIADMTLLDVVSPYFRYEVMTLCGIPEFTLLGTEEDWVSLQTKALELIRSIGMDFWVAPLNAFLEECIRVFQGRGEESFWDSFAKESSSSGTPRVSGRILALFPYLEDKAGAKVRNTWDRSYPSSWIPCGVRQTPFLWLLGSESSSIPMKVASGFLGIAVEGDSLRPCRGFAVFKEE